MTIIFQGTNFNFEFVHCIIFRFQRRPSGIFNFNNFLIYCFKISGGLLLICGRGCPFVFQTFFFFSLNRARFHFLDSLKLVQSCDSLVANRMSLEATQVTSKPGPKYFPYVIFYFLYLICWLNSQDSEY